MHVIATAGHVDHGKSTLVRALTGTDPDRLEEERRRGLTIELGYAWTDLPPVGDVAFVDVPGHERFLRTMLSGVGPVPAVLLVVAADDPWMPQAAEHLGALSALGVTRGVVAVTRSDLADPAPMGARARTEVDRTPLRGAPVVAVSGATGEGVPALRRVLVDLVSALPAPAPSADVRMWVDRAFHVRGAGTVVTGTLPAGTVRVGDRLDACTSTGTGTVRVRGIQSLGRPADAVAGVARVALNVVTDDRSELDRDSVLVTPGAWHLTDVLDVRLTPTGAGGARLPEEAHLHVGAAGSSAHVRPFDDRHARLTLERPLPLRVGDRAVLRDPGNRRMWGVVVLDPAPPSLRRRGAGARRGRSLLDHPGRPDLAWEVSRRGVVPAALLRRIGVPDADGDIGAGDWLVGDEAATLLRQRLRALVTTHDQEHPLAPGVPLPALAQALGLPTPDLVPPLVRAPLRLVDGRVTAGPPRTGLPVEVERALDSLAADLADAPFAAPPADRLAALGLHHRAVAAATRAGRLLDLGGGVVLLPGSDRLAATRLGELPQPFTTSQARRHLVTSRRVALPLLGHLDRVGLTVRHADDRRSVRVG